jgi:hypothetical protein
LTKETDARVAAQAAKMEGREPWSKGLTKEVDPRLQATADKLKQYVGDDWPWDNGLRADLTLWDFLPFLDEEGKVDRRLVVDYTGLSWVTLRKYMADLSLETSNRYIKERAENATIRLDKETLQQYALKNGKVSIAKAMRGTGHCFSVVARECERNGLETFHRRIRQTLCMEAVSEALGGISYVMEWERVKFSNPKTGRRFRFDGYFEACKLVVEFHGHQHYMFPNAFLPDESYEQEYLAMRWRDRVKREMIEADPVLVYMEIREDEPFEDVGYLRGRLLEMGVLAL